MRLLTFSLSKASFSLRRGAMGEGFYCLTGDESPKLSFVARLGALGCRHRDRLLMACVQKSRKDAYRRLAGAPYPVRPAGSDSMSLAASPNALYPGTLEERIKASGIVAKNQPSP